MRDCGSGCTYRKGCILERDTKPSFDVISLLGILETATLPPVLPSTPFQARNQYFKYPFTVSAF